VCGLANFLFLNPEKVIYSRMQALELHGTELLLSIDKLPLYQYTQLASIIDINIFNVFIEIIKTRFLFYIFYFINCVIK